MKTWVRIDSENKVTSIWQCTQEANPIGASGSDLIDATGKENVELGSTCNPAAGTFTAPEPPSEE